MAASLANRFIIGFTYNYIYPFWSSKVDDNKCSDERLVLSELTDLTGGLTGSVQGEGKRGNSPL